MWKFSAYAGGGFEIRCPEWSGPAAREVGAAEDEEEGGMNERRKKALLEKKLLPKYA